MVPKKNATNVHVNVITLYGIVKSGNGKVIKRGFV